LNSRQSIKPLLILKLKSRQVEEIKIEVGDENIKKQINLEINVGMKDSVVSDRGMYQTTNKLSA